MRIHRVKEQHLANDLGTLLDRQGRVIEIMRQCGHEDKEIRDKADTLVAYVNRGRWVADCEADRCDAGIAVSPNWKTAACFGCGARYKKVKWPRDRKKAELVLEKRPVMNSRNWRGETLAVLRAENAAHGIGVGRPN